jgi:hypothetical protein
MQHGGNVEAKECRRHTQPLLHKDVFNILTHVDGDQAPMELERFIVTHEKCHGSAHLNELNGSFLNNKGI